MSVNVHYLEGLKSISKAAMSKAAATCRHLVGLVDWQQVTNGALECNERSLSMLIKATVPGIRGRALLRTTAVDVIHGDGAESFWCHRAAVTIDIAVRFARLQHLSNGVEHHVSSLAIIYYDYGYRPREKLSWFLFFCLFFLVSYQSNGRDMQKLKEW